LTLFGFILANSENFAWINFSEYPSEKISRVLIFGSAMIFKNKI